jgi:aspartyl-tRNA synthetase
VVKIKKFVVLLAFCFLLASCSSSTKQLKETEQEGNVESINAESNEEFDKEQEEIDSLEEVVVKLIENEEYKEVTKKLKNYYKKNEYTELYNYAYALASKGSGNTDAYLDALNEIPDEYRGVLSSEIKEEKEKSKEIELALNVPLFEKLEEDGYVVETMSSFNGIKINDRESDVTSMLIIEDIKYDLCSNGKFPYCGFIALSNRVIQFENQEVKEIFIIKNEKGEVLNPKNVDILVKEAARESRIRTKEAFREDKLIV